MNRNQFKDFETGIRFLYEGLDGTFVPVCLRRDNTQGARWYEVTELLSDLSALYADIMWYNIMEDWTIELKPATFLEARGKYETGKYEYAAFVQSIQFDCDGIQPMEKVVERMALNSVMPNLVKQSSADETHFHCYWRLEHPLRLDANGIDAYRKVALALAHNFGGDPQLQSPVQPLRAAGTYNTKQAEHYLTTWDYVYEFPYRLEDFRHLYTKQRRQRRPIDIPVDEEKRKEIAYQQIQRRISDLASARSEVNNELNGAATFCAKRAEAAGISLSELSAMLENACAENGYASRDPGGMRATIRSAFGANYGTWDYTEAAYSLTRTGRQRRT